MLEGIQRMYSWVVSFGNSLQPSFLLIIRLFWGWQFFIGGWNKLQNITPIVNFFSKLDIPFPWFTAHLVGGVEFFGGLCLLLGLASRLAAIPLIITMVTAIFLAHPISITEIIKDPFSLVQTVPFSFLFAMLIILIFGPGTISLDGLLKRLISRSR